jgi:hypothetical protein
MAPGGTVTTRVVTDVTVHETGKILVRDTVSNRGNDTAYHVTITSFLGNDARQSDILGENRPGGSLQYACDFDGAALNPGRYILVTRIHFIEKNGTPHWVHHFHPFDLRASQGRGESRLTAAIEAPVINRKSPAGPKGNLRISLKNGHPVPIEPVLYFALPEGLKMGEGERAIRLNAGQEKTMDMPISATSAVKGEIPFTAIVRYEADKTHHALQIQGKVLVEERPVLFKLFLAIGTVLLLVVLALVFWFRHDRAGRSGT